MYGEYAWSAECKRHFPGTVRLAAGHSIAQLPALAGADRGLSGGSTNSVEKGPTPWTWTTVTSSTHM